MKRRPDLPEPLKRTEEILRETMRHLAETFAPKLVTLIVFDRSAVGFTSYTSNANREDMIVKLRDLADRLEADVADTAGREA